MVAQTKNTEDGSNNGQATDADAQTTAEADDGQVTHAKVFTGPSGFHAAPWRLWRDAAGARPPRSSPSADDENGNASHGQPTAEADPSAEADPDADDTDAGADDANPFGPEAKPPKDCTAKVVSAAYALAHCDRISKLNKKSMAQLELPLRISDLMELQMWPALSQTLTYGDVMDWHTKQKRGNWTPPSSDDDDYLSNECAAYEDIFVAAHGIDPTATVGPSPIMASRYDKERRAAVARVIEDITMRIEMIATFGRRDSEASGVTYPTSYSPGQLVLMDVPLDTVRALVRRSLGTSGTANITATARIIRELLNEARHGPTAGGRPPRWMDIDEMDAQEPPKMLIEGVLAEGFTHLTGASQALKTFIALDMALSLVTGTPFLNHRQFAVPEPMKVMFVAGEGTAGVPGRVRVWCRERGVDMADLKGRFIVHHGSVQFTSPQDMEHVRAKAIETGAGLIIFDTQARCAVDVDENSASSVGRIVAAQEKLTLDTGASVMLLHHPTKTNDKTARGSNAMEGAVDNWLITVRDGTKLETTLTAAKTKDDAPPPEIAMKATAVQIPGRLEGKTSLVLSYVDPFTVDADPDLPVEDWTGNGSNFVVPMFKLAQRHCTPGDGLTKYRLAEIANEVIGTDKTQRYGKTKPVRRVCSRGTANGALTLLIKHGKLIVSKKDNLGHTFYEPSDWLPPDPGDQAIIDRLDAPLMKDQPAASGDDD